MERGVMRTALAAYSNGDEFRIRRIGTTVDYLHNRRRVATSAVASSGTISVGCVLYASGDSI
jgi:hypothetical protein